MLSIKDALILSIAPWKLASNIYIKNSLLKVSIRDTENVSA